MDLYLDAWLERRDPCVRVMDHRSGKEVFRLTPERVQELIESGDLDPADLENSTYCLELINDLKARVTFVSDPTRLRAPTYFSGAAPHSNSVSKL